jgi:hypothetical protein
MFRGIHAATALLALVAVAAVPCCLLMEDRPLSCMDEGCPGGFACANDDICRTWCDADELCDDGYLCCTKKRFEGSLCADANTCY